MTIEDLGRLTGGYLYLGQWKGGTELYTGPDNTILQSDGTLWNFSAGQNLMYTTDTTEYATGSSSRKIKLNYDWAASIPAFQVPMGLAKYNNVGQTLSSITLKMKKSSNISNIVCSVSNTVRPRDSYATVNVNDNTFQDYTIDVTSVTLPDIMKEQDLIWYLNIGELTSADPDNVYLWLDSVTFNYV